MKDNTFSLFNKRHTRRPGLSLLEIIPELPHKFVALVQEILDAIFEKYFWLIWKSRGHRILDLCDERKSVFT
jgi:hypothetical protein